MQILEMQGKFRHIHLTFSSACMTRQAQFAHLCTVMLRMHHRRQGYPFGAFMDFAADDSGRKSVLIESCNWCSFIFIGCLNTIEWPFVLQGIVNSNMTSILLPVDLIFSFSPLAIYTRNLLADPRCTVVIQVCSVNSFGGTVYWLQCFSTCCLITAMCWVMTFLGC